MSRQQAAKLENMFTDMGAEQVSKLNLIVKTDVRGSLEAINSALHDFATDEVAVDIVASGVGGITESDINLALTTGAIVLGFNVRAGGLPVHWLRKKRLKCVTTALSTTFSTKLSRPCRVCWHLKPAKRLLVSPKCATYSAHPSLALLPAVWSSRVRVYRNKPIRVLRDDVVIYQGELESLRRFKDDAQDVRNGMECGIGVKDYNDVKPGDLIEVYDVTQVERSL